MIRIKRKIYDPAPKQGLNISRPERPGPHTCKFAEAPALCPLSGRPQQQHGPQPLAGLLMRSTAPVPPAWTPEVFGIARAASVSGAGPLPPLAPQASHAICSVRSCPFLGRVAERQAKTSGEKPHFKIELLFLGKQRSII